jgi:NADH-ubiquinone oxidoreductase chain 2
MLFISIISLSLVAALPSFFIKQLPENCYNRLTAIVLVYCAILTFNSLNIESLDSGIAIYGGLFHVNIISQYMDIILFITASFILIAWPLIKYNTKKIILVNDNIISYNADEKRSTISINNEKSNLEGIETNNQTLKIFNLHSREENSLKSISYTKNYSIIILFSILGSSLLISSYDLISMYLSIELQSFAVYVLATLYKNSENSTSAGLKYFLLGGLSSCFILFGSGLIYGYTGLTNFESIYSLMSVSEINNVISSNINSSLINSDILSLGGGGFFLGIIFIIVGFLFKIAAAPLHNWSPAKHFGKML